MHKILKYNTSEIAIDDRISGLVKYIKKHDSDFEPPISTKIDIFEYSKKLLTLANVLICMDKGEIKAVAAYYCNSNKYEYAFLTYLSVDIHYRSRGIVGELIKIMIKDCAKKKVKRIYTSTWLGNSAINIYKYYGFIQDENSFLGRVELYYEL